MKLALKTALWWPSVLLRNVSSKKNTQPTLSMFHSELSKSPQGSCVNQGSFWPLWSSCSWDHLAWPFQQIHHRKGKTKQDPLLEEKSEPSSRSSSKLMPLLMSFGAACGLIAQKTSCHEFETPVKRCLGIPNLLLPTTCGKVPSVSIRDGGFNPSENYVPQNGWKSSPNFRGEHKKMIESNHHLENIRAISYKSFTRCKAVLGSIPLLFTTILGWPTGGISVAINCLENILDANSWNSFNCFIHNTGVRPRKIHRTKGHQCLVVDLPSGSLQYTIGLRKCNIRLARLRIKHLILLVVEPTHWKNK